MFGFSKPLTILTLLCYEYLKLNFEGMTFYRLKAELMQHVLKTRLIIISQTSHSIGITANRHISVKVEC